MNLKSYLDRVRWFSAATFALSGKSTVQLHCKFERLGYDLYDQEIVTVDFVVKKFNSFCSNQLNEFFRWGTLVPILLVREQYIGQYIACWRQTMHTKYLYKQLYQQPFLINNFVISGWKALWILLVHSRYLRRNCNLRDFDKLYT